MNTSRNRIPVTALIVLMSLFAISACTTMGARTERQLDRLRHQVELVWTSKTRMQWGTVWDNTVREYQQRIPRERFVANANVQITAYTIEDLQLVEPGARAMAVVAYKMRVQGFTLPNTSKEEWLMEKGTWRVNLVPSLDASPFSPKKQK